jgi:hypothetical protein
LAQSDAHDLPGSVDEGIPGIAAVIDDIVVGFEDAVMLASTAGTTGGS